MYHFYKEVPIPDIIYHAERFGKIRKVWDLQRLLMKSQAALLLSIRRVTQINKGKRTAGVDGYKALTPYERVELYNKMKDLNINSHRPKPTYRTYIEKKNGKLRPLGNKYLKRYFEKRDIKEFDKNNVTYRQKLAKKQKYKCPLCTHSITDGSEGLETHHKIPRVKGGKNEYKNLELVHISCHLEYHKVFPAKGEPPNDIQLKSVKSISKARNYQDYSSQSLDKGMLEPYVGKLTRTVLRGDGG